MKKIVTRESVRRVAVELYDIRNRNVGLGEFTWQLGEGIARRADELYRRYGLKFWYVVPAHMTGVFGDGVHYIPVIPNMRKLSRFYPVPFDLVHITHQYSRIKRLYSAREQLLTVHDINFVYEKPESQQEGCRRRFLKRLAEADYLSFISNFAHDDVTRHFRIRHPSCVIYNGVADLRCESGGDVARFGLPENYLFHISSLMPKKNVHLLVDMMRHLPQENLVIVGSWDTPYAEELRRIVARDGLRNIITLDNVTNAEKAALYAGCRGFLFPSLCEGFGLPPMEAMWFGKPVFLSTLTSLPEVGGEEAYYWDDLRPEPMARMVEAGLADFYSSPGRSRRMVDRVSRFTWDRCVDGYLDYYLELLGVSRLEEKRRAVLCEI